MWCELVCNPYMSGNIFSLGLVWTTQQDPGSNINYTTLVKMELLFSSGFKCYSWHFRIDIGMCLGLLSTEWYTETSPSWYSCLSTGASFNPYSLTIQASRSFVFSEVNCTCSTLHRFPQAPFSSYQINALVVFTHLS